VKARRIDECDPTRGQSCPLCSGESAEQDEYWDRRTTRPQRRAYDRAMGAWWLARADEQRKTA
jgi:hypothetical protein